MAAASRFLGALLLLALCRAGSGAAHSRWAVGRSSAPRHSPRAVGASRVRAAVRASDDAAAAAEGEASDDAFDWDALDSPAYECGEAKVTQTLGEASGAKLSDRFSYARRALAGEFDPDPTTAPADADSETGAGLLAGLVTFPATLDFTVVATRAGADAAAADADAALAAELSALVREAAGLAPTSLAVAPRGARFVSCKLQVLCGSAESARAVHAAFKAHPRVRMSF